MESRWVLGMKTDAARKTIVGARLVAMEFNRTHCLLDQYWGPDPALAGMRVLASVAVSSLDFCIGALGYL